MAIFPALQKLTHICMYIHSNNAYHKSHQSYIGTSETFLETKNEDQLKHQQQRQHQNKHLRYITNAYDSFSERRVWFASKNLTPCRMH